MSYFLVENLGYDGLNIRQFESEEEVMSAYELSKSDILVVEGEASVIKGEVVADRGLSKVWEVNK